MAYVPSGFWSRLISRLMINLKRSGLVESDGASKVNPSMTYWKRGILVSHSSGKFLVEAIQAGTKKGKFYSILLNRISISYQRCLVLEWETML